MKTIWFQGIKDPDKRAAFEQGLRSSTLALGRLHEILEGREKELTSQLISTPDGESWAFKQAHLSGRLFDLREIKDLISFIKGP